MNKKYLRILWIVLLALPLFGKAQTTLEYSRVLMVSSNTQTVPVGKVWKVESFWQSEVNFTSSINSGGCNYESWHSPFMVNGNSYYNFGSGATGLNATYITPGNDFPLWLPAGTTVQTQCPGDFLSIIEFNEAP